MPDLVALDLPPGPAFVDALRRAWDRGDAVCPVDQRLAGPAREATLAAVAAGWIVGSEGERARLAGGAPVDDGDALVMPTSGTTGDPKGVVLTHDAVRASAVATSTWLDVDAGADQWLACLPLAHMGGLGVVTRALVTGTPLVVHERFDPAAVEAAARDGATLTTLVPTAFARVDVSGFRAVVVGGAPVPGGLPPNAVTSYGLTETCGGCVYDGRPVDGCEVRVVDGEIQVRGAMLLRAYRDGRDPRDADGWLATGDLGELDAGGRLVCHGRRGDLIITGGENVWPQAVERLLETHAAVAEVAVTGAPDPEWGRRVVAYVVPADPAAPPSLDDLRGFVKERLAPYAAPRELVLVESLPRTAVGKLQRSFLRPPGSPARAPGRDPEATRNISGPDG